MPMPKMPTTTNEEGALTSGVARFISWSLDDGASRLDITVQGYIGTLPFHYKGQ
jgi:hypothetical protein